jgi:hypothetical protein
VIAARGGAQRRWPVPPGSAPSAPLFPASELKGAFWSSGNVELIGWLKEKCEKI